MGFSSRKLFYFWKKKKKWIKEIHTHTHTEVAMVEALLKPHFLQKASPDPQNWK